MSKLQLNLPINNRLYVLMYEVKLDDNLTLHYLRKYANHKLLNHPPPPKYECSKSKNAKHYMELIDSIKSELPRWFNKKINLMDLINRISELDNWF